MPLMPLLNLSFILNLHCPSDFFYCFSPLHKYTPFGFILHWQRLLLTSSSISSQLARWDRPALFTKISSPPNCWSTLSKLLLWYLIWVTSSGRVRMFCGWAPAWMHRFLTRSRPTALRADRTSLAPCLDSCTARASPIPLDAPEKNWVFERRKFL